MHDFHIFIIKLSLQLFHHILLLLNFHTLQTVILPFQLILYFCTLTLKPIQFLHIYTSNVIFFHSGNSVTSHARGNIIDDIIVWLQACSMEHEDGITK